MRYPTFFRAAAVIHDQLQLEEYRNTMKTWRKRVLPAIPDNLNDLHRKLNEFEKVKDFYRGSATASDGSRIFLFIHPGMIGPLSQVREALGDGTFKVIMGNKLSYTKDTSRNLMKVDFLIEIFALLKCSNGNLSMQREKSFLRQNFDNYHD